MSSNLPLARCHKVNISPENEHYQQSIEWSIKLQPKKKKLEWSIKISDVSKKAAEKKCKMIYLSDFMARNVMSMLLINIDIILCTNIVLEQVNSTTLLDKTTSQTNTINYTSYPEDKTWNPTKTIQIPNISTNLHILIKTQNDEFIQQDTGVKCTETHLCIIVAMATIKNLIATRSSDVTPPTIMWTSVKEIYQIIILPN